MMDMEETREFPARCARGIRDEEWVYDSPPYRRAFLFDNTVRDDGKREMSVSWMVDHGAIDVLLKMRYGGEPVFHAGIGVLRLARIIELQERFKNEVTLGYEWRKTRNNPYHGNITIGDCPAIDMHRVASKLADSADVYRRDETIPFDDR